MFKRMNLDGLRGAATLAAAVGVMATAHGQDARPELLREHEPRVHEIIRQRQEEAAKKGGAAQAPAFATDLNATSPRVGRKSAGWEPVGFSPADLSEAIRVLGISRLRIAEVDSTGKRLVVLERGRAQRQIGRLMAMLAP